MLTLYIKGYVLETLDLYPQSGWILVWSYVLYFKYLRRKCINKFRKAPGPELWPTLWPLLGLNVALIHQVKLYPDSETKDNYEKPEKEVRDGNDRKREDSDN